MNNIFSFIEKRAEGGREVTAFKFYSPDSPSKMSYSELCSKSLSIAKTLLAVNRKASRALILAPAGEYFVLALFSCFRAGITAIPAYPPKSQADKVRLRLIYEDCSPDLIITTREWIEAVKLAFPKSYFLAVDGVIEVGEIPQARKESLALIQYTSGSTGSPKGVMISHENLLSNLKDIQLRFGHTESSIGVSWLPPFHDMGLIGGILQPVFCGFPVTIMTPHQFLRNPADWLKVISTERATTSGAPNGAFDLCVNSIGEADKQGVDLSSWKVCFCGAEMIRKETLDRFSRVFRSVGFKRRSFLPCYGLAEATLLVACGRLGKGAGAVNTQRFGGRIHRGSPRIEARWSVSCGTAPQETVLEIVTESQVSAREGEVGEIWIAGSCVAQGYWNKRDATRSRFKATLRNKPDMKFLRTGDFGCINDGELYILGRLDDAINVSGRKIHPEDLEYISKKRIRSLRKSRIVFTGSEDHGRGIMAFVEGTGLDLDKLETIAKSLAEVVISEFDVYVAKVVFIKRTAFPVTTSGKVRRKALYSLYTAGTLATIYRWALPDKNRDGRENEKAVRFADRRKADDMDLLLAACPPALQITAEQSASHLFSLGLQSLQIMQFLADFNAKSDIRLSLRDLISNPSLYKLCVLIKARRRLAAKRDKDHGLQQM